MKKVLKVMSAGILSAVVAVSAAASVSAAGVNDAEQKILDELRTSVSMNGVDKTLPVDYINQAENYFNTVEVTEEEANQIVALIESTKEYLSSTGASNISALSEAQLNELVAKSNSVVSVINLTLTYDKASSVVTVKDQSGKSVWSTTVKTNSSSNGGSSTTNNIGSTNNGSSVNNGGSTANNSSNSGNSGSVVSGNPIKTTGADFNIPGVTAVAGVGILLVSAAGVYLLKTSKKAQTANAKA